MNHETEEDSFVMEKYEKRLGQLGYKANHKIGFGNATSDISRIVKKEEVDFLVIGVDDGKGIEDVILGTTLHTARHKIKVPVLIVNSCRGHYLKLLFYKGS
ncbi:hypothetical protein B4Q04_05055 [Zobellia sp. OII3]|uniref:universal stress protein n=1 Tax=Zobellia sp. OII3 TaxID=2034520 RepID=UPI000B53500C|nr:universal stress protein [Zobellia sp. OII3]OWW27046.1 hypothetical protein B4Q04_05055 [Zobellia sp. OII3]